MQHTPPGPAFRLLNGSRRPSRRGCRGASIGAGLDWKGLYVPCSLLLQTCQLGSMPTGRAARRFLNAADSNRRPIYIGGDVIWRCQHAPWAYRRDGLELSRSTTQWWRLASSSSACAWLSFSEFDMMSCSRVPGSSYLSFNDTSINLTDPASHGLARSLHLKTAWCSYCYPYLCLGESTERHRHVWHATAAARPGSCQTFDIQPPDVAC